MLQINILVFTWKSFEKYARNVLPPLKRTIDNLIKLCTEWNKKMVITLYGFHSFFSLTF